MRWCSWHMVHSPSMLLFLFVVKWFCGDQWKLPGGSALWAEPQEPEGLPEAEMVVVRRLRNHRFCLKACYFFPLAHFIPPSSAGTLFYQSLSLSFPDLLLFPSHSLEASLWCPWPHKVTDCWVMRCCSGAAGSPCSPLMGTLYRFQMEAGCCIQDSSLAVQGEMDLVQVTFTTNYQAVFHVDVRPVLGQQLYQLDLVQLIIYCREMGVKWARRHILCEPWDTSDSSLCNLSRKSLKLSEF